VIRRGVTHCLTLIVFALAASAATRPAEAQTLAAILTGQPQARGVQAPGPTAPAGDALFGTLEFTGSSLQALPQWRRILDAMAQESSDMVRCTADSAKCTSPALRSWRELQLQAQSQGRMDKLHIINQFFNRWPYKSDAEAFGRREYWASPTTFMSRSGDCEDYAIAKYFALRQLGFDKEELRIVVLYDRIRNVGHAVLAVYDGDDILILDSLSNFITTHTRYRHYIPQYSMNETTRWAHVDQSRAIPQTALRAADN
jgi:predicted transglutaminase-like cysteine proteinase